ncbi:twin-arginine translocase TatA/TatE family subunit [Terriglobus aquaticus]
MGDSIFIFVLALMLLGPKKLPQLARQLGKLMAEFRKASNDFRMQMEDELRLEEQKEHQAKVAALQPPTPAAVPVEDPPHPHMPAPVSEVAPEAAEAAVASVQPIAESGELKMMPPSSGLPMESSARTRSYAPAEPAAEIPEHSIGGALSQTSLGAGSSSEEPAAELPPPPDRSQPAMVGEGERATHV